MKPAMGRWACVAILVLLTSLAGCKETGTSGEGGKPGRLPELGAAEFYRDYASLRGADLLSKYKHGVVVTGPVKQIMNLGKDEGLQIWLPADEPGHIAARFQDGGAAARQRNLKVGDDVKLRCQIGGKPDIILFLSNCTFEPNPPSR